MLRLTPTDFNFEDNTDEIAEGLINLYFTNARADARVNLQTGANLDQVKNTGDLSEGSKLISKRESRCKNYKCYC